MTKFTAFTIWTLLAVSILIITPHRSKLGRSKARVASVQEQRDNLSDLVEENARLSNVIAQTQRPEAPPNETPRELLRLRGEVARLGQENVETKELLQEKDEEIAKLQNRVPIDSLREIYAASGIDTNLVPHIELGATTNQVLAELDKVGARVLIDQNKFGQHYIQAETFPSADTSANGNLAAIKMEFYFEGGDLISRKDWPNWRKVGGF